MDKIRDWLLLAGVNWRPVALLMRSRIGQVSALIPIIGYLLLWSRWADETFALQVELGNHQWFVLQTRLLFIYLGAWAMTIAWLIYLFRCPAEIRRTPEIEDYLSDQLRTNDESSTASLKNLLSDLLQENPEAKNSRIWKPKAPVTLQNEMNPNRLYSARFDHPVQKTVILRSQYYCCLGTNPYSAFFVISIALLGLGLMAIPAAETLWLVIRRVLLPTLGLV